jgi:dyslexia susceptibility 1 candidate gene 1 protein
MLAFAAVWLKGKGDDFYRSGDYAGASNAYTAAIDLDASNAACYSNRSACYLHLLKLEECVADCTSALALTPSGGEAAAAAPAGGPGLPKALQSRVRLLARRGTALAQLGKYAEALADFQTAGSLDRTDPTLATIASDLSRLAECT